MSDTSKVEFWNGKAKPFSHYERRSPYASEFLEYAAVKDGESVFDMGCGSGTLCIPLHDDGHEVFCADFSEEMLASVAGVIEEENITGLTLKQMTWQDDWSALDLPVCDLAFASRSMFSIEPEKAVRKLDSVARRRVCMSVAVNASMFANDESAYSMGEHMDRMAYLKGILGTICDLGYYPELRYFSKWKDDKPTWAFVAFDKTN